MEVSLGAIYWNSLSRFTRIHSEAKANPGNQVLARCRTGIRSIAPYSETVETRLRMPQDVGGVRWMVTTGCGAAGKFSSRGAGTKN